MSLKKISKDQPENFKFISKNLIAAEKVISNYFQKTENSLVDLLKFFLNSSINLTKHNIH